MGNMPEWFAKTAEMAASDVWFSEKNAGGKAQLGERYLQALQALDAAPRAFFAQSVALDAAVTRGDGPLDQNRADHALNVHFRGDWIHERYDPGTAATARLGGRFWPTIPSEQVVDVLSMGTRMALLKGLGETNLLNMGMNQDTIETLFKLERDAGINTFGIRPMATSWNCVAPPGSGFFEAAALRGPSVVELAIATPRPVELTRFAILFELIGRDLLSLDVNTDVDINDSEPD
jgi:hypothetical protein